MEKQVLYMGKTASGIFCQSLFGSAGAFEKVAGAPAFADWETGDELRKFIAGISKEDRKKNAYTLVNALGAGEYFGSNINADYFPWNALTHEGDDYGYKTFLRAHAFQHHVNKDPDRAFGVPVLSLINTKMKRVELIIKLDREKAKKEGADGIVVRIDKGEFPDVSMGCKVPYDVCSICSNRSKTRADYCQHILARGSGDGTTPLVFPVHTERARYDTQAIGKVNVLFAGMYEAETSVFDGTGLAFGDPLMVSDVTFGGLTRRGLKKATSGKAVVGYVTKLPTGKVRFLHSGYSILA